jgi:glutamate-1-semialdehyde 2,1-aminomutase
MFWKRFKTSRFGAFARALRNRMLDKRGCPKPGKPMSAAQAQTVIRRRDPAHYTPSQGIPRNRQGRAYPILIKEALGARIRDSEGNEWIDYVMGWGSALLGYAHPRIRSAIAESLNCGAILSLPHVQEAEVVRLLCASIPCAEMALFGKNGSDVCTAAVRVARLSTGRRVVLFSGYHGWQEPFASVFEPALADPHQSVEVFKFPAHDFGTLSRLVAEHDGKIAAIMLEPAGQIEGIDGPVRNADASYLRRVAETCRKQDALLIFDEIMTGFRYPTGSVQKATDIVPDLACFGKALSGGMPLSVLLGRRGIMETTISRLFYHPTFKGDLYSFAASTAALNVYREEDIPTKIDQFGRALCAGVNRISEELGIPGGLVGVPYRLVYRFDESDSHRRTCLRTLLQQELLKLGILTFRGFMLPSIAHGKIELEQTLLAFQVALTRVKVVAERDSFTTDLELPLII